MRVRGGDRVAIHEDLLDLVETLVDSLHCPVERLLVLTLWLKYCGFRVFEIFVDHSRAFAFQQRASWVSPVAWLSVKVLLREILCRVLQALLRLV